MIANYVFRQIVGCNATVASKKYICLIICNTPINFKWSIPFGKVDKT